MENYRQFTAYHMIIEDVQGFRTTRITLRYIFFLDSLFILTLLDFN